MPARKPKAPKAASKQAHKRVPVHRFEKDDAVQQSDAADTGKAFPIEIDPKRVEEALGKIRDELVVWANKGRYTKVRFKFRGKQLLPDIPLAAFVAAQGLTFYWGGIIRALVFNLAGKTVFDVEMVNDSEKRLARGKEYLLSGDLDQALECFRDAERMDRDNANVHLNLGVALKLKGDFGAARIALEKAKELDKEGPIGVEADRLLGTMQRTQAQVVPAG